MGAKNLEVLFTPAEFEALRERDLAETDCVVMDVLRATSSMVTALANGAAGIVPVEEISEALALRRTTPDLLLAGERDGLRIEAEMSGGAGFDLGNSPREFTRVAVEGRTIVMTTTNGTRALRACAHARSIVVGAFANLTATANHLETLEGPNLILVCGGTFDEAGYEDVLCAGALIGLLGARDARELADSAYLARRLYQLERRDLVAALSQSRNGRTCGTTWLSAHNVIEPAWPRAWRRTAASGRCPFSLDRHRV